MAILWMMCFWMAFLHSVCREETGKQQISIVKAVIKDNCNIMVNMVKMDESVN